MDGRTDRRGRIKKLTTDKQARAGITIRLVGCYRLSRRFCLNANGQTDIRTYKWTDGLTEEEVSKNYISLCGLNHDTQFFLNNPLPLLCFCSR